MQNQKRYCDLMGFLNWQGHLPISDPSVTKYVKLMHVTSAPPFRRDLTGKELPLSRDYILDYHESFKAEIEGQSFLKPIFLKDDLLNLGDNETGIVYGLQNAPDDMDINDLNLLYSRSVRVMAPCYQGINQYGGGFLHPQEKLSEKGKNLIHDLVQAGFIIDLAHCGHQTALDILTILEDLNYQKVMASHTGLFEVYKNPRNITLEIANRIIGLNGLIGVYALTFGLDGSYDESGYSIFHLKRMIMDSVIDVVKLENLCFGTDSIYKFLDFGEWELNIERMIKMVDPDHKMGARFPDIPFDLNTPAKLQVLAHQFRDFLVDDFTKNATDKIMHDNIWNFFMKNL